MRSMQIRIKNMQLIIWELPAAVERMWKRKKNPVRIGTDLKIYRASNTISTVTCPDIRYGETPKPELTAADTTGEIKYTYSSTENGEYKEWNAENKLGRWYVKAAVSQSRNYEKAESTPVAFTVSKALLDPSVNTLQSKTYDGGTKAEGTLTLSSTDGNPIPLQRMRWH